MGCEFQSRNSRTLTAKNGSLIARHGCFSKHLAELWDGADCADGYCGFHDPRPAVFQEYAGAKFEQAFGLALKTYIESQQLGKLSTLDLCGLKMRLRNSEGLFDLIRSYELNIFPIFEQIILDEALFSCPISLSNVNAPATSMRFAKSVFEEDLAILNVVCDTLDFSECRFSRETISIVGLECQTITLAKAQLKTLKITSSKLHRLILDDAEIGTIELVDSSIGAVGQALNASGPLDAGGMSLRALKSDIGNIADMTLKNLQVAGPIDLRGRTITSTFLLDNVRLHAPMKLIRNFCNGELTIDNLKEQPQTSGPEARLWERMYTELTLASLHVGDRGLWADFAIKEQEIRIARSKNPLAKFLLRLDKHVSNNGTDITKPLVWLALALIAYSAMFGLIDLTLTERWRSARNIFTFWTNQISYAILQMVKPFNAIEKFVAGNPGSPVDSSVVVLACSESAICLLLLGSILFAIRHHLSALN